MDPILADDDSPPTSSEPAEPVGVNSSVTIYLIALLVIIALIIVIVIPISYPHQAYGSYRLASDRCIANGDHCADGGTRTIIYDCIPNPTTGQPCLHNGKLTFDSIITTEPCNVQCYSSKWVLTETTCQGNNLMDVYQCQRHDPTGVNDCGIIDKIPYDNGYIKQYVIKGIGSTKTKLNKVNGCNSVIPEGKWVYVGPKNTIQTNEVSDRYHLSKSCEAEYHLQEGTYKIKPACLIDGNLNLDGAGCDPNTKPVDQIQLCRKYLVPTKIDNIIDKLYGSYLTIKRGNQYLGLAEVEVGQAELIFQETPTPFFFAPRNINKTGMNYQFTAIIACLPTLGRNGWVTRNGNNLLWTPASDGPGLPGIKSDQATLFEILIVRDKYLTIKNTSIINAELELYPIDSISSFYA